MLSDLRCSCTDNSAISIDDKYCPSEEIIKNIIKKKMKLTTEK